MAPEALADLYVRHAMALRDADRPPPEWELGPAGRAAARELAAQLPRSVATALVVSSTEPKALATAAPIAERFGVEVVPDERLVEAHRPWVGSPNDYRSMAHRYLAGYATPGWEDAAAVVDRMAAAVREARASVPGERIAVVSHGLVPLPPPGLGAAGGLRPRRPLGPALVPRRLDGRPRRPGPVPLPPVTEVSPRRLR